MKRSSLLLPDNDELEQLRARVALLDKELAERESYFQQREAQLRNLADNITDVVVRFDRQFRHVYINKAITKVTGLLPKDFIGKTNRELGMDADLCNSWEEALEQVFQTGEGQLIEFTFPAPDGSGNYYYQSQLTPASGKNGQVEFVDCVSRNISTDKLAQNIQLKLVREQTARLEAEEAQRSITNILDSITDAFIALDEEWCYVYINPKAEQLLGSSRGVLLGHNIWEKWPEETSSLFYRECHRAMANGQSLSFENFSPALGKWIENHLYPTEVGLAIYFRDITERKETEAVLHFQSNILGQINEAVIATDKNQQVTYWNAAAERLYGYSSEEALGHTLQELNHYVFLHPEDEQEAYSKLEQVGAWNGLALHHNRQGQAFKVVASTNTLKDITGNPIGLLGVIRDVSELEKAEQKLKVTEARLQAIMDNSTVNIYVKDRLGRYLMINEHIERIFGNRREDWIGKTDFELFPEWAEGWWANDSKVMETAQAYEWEEEAPQPDGMHVYLSRKFPLYDENGAVYAMCGMSTDITERRQRMDAQKELNYLKDLFLSIATHELRTPLTAIKGYTQLLERNFKRRQAELGEDDNNLKRLIEQPLEVIKQQSERMNNLINQLLDFSRLQNQQFQLNYQTEVNLVELVKRVIESQGVITQDHQLKLNLPEGSLLARCDEARIEQVLNNLITNALKYSPVGSLVEVGLERRENTAVFWVKDQGMGISESDQQQIFDRFYRVRSSGTERVEGLGLGLYISHELVVQHRGQMWLESQIGEGSKFYFSIPLAAS